MVVNVRKFSQFVPGTLDDAVGLAAGANAIGPGGGGGAVTKTITQATAGLAVPDWVRVNNAGLYVPAIADSPEDAEVQGVVIEIIDANTFVLQQSGPVAPGTFAGLVPNQIYFLSDTVAGTMTQAAPTANGHVRQPVFNSDSADTGFVICLKTGMVIGSPGPIPSVAQTPDSNIQQFSQAGNTFMLGQWVRVAGDNAFALADATSLANSQSVGVVTSAGNPLFTVQFSGFNSNTVTAAVDAVGNPIAIVASTPYYLSPVTPGAITPIQPTVIGQYSKPCYISVSAIGVTGFILPQKPTPTALIGPNNLVQFVHVDVSAVSTVVIPANVWTNIPPIVGTITPLNVGDLIKLSCMFGYGSIQSGGRRYFRFLRNGVTPVGVGAGLAIQSTLSITNAFTESFLIVDAPASVAPQTYQLQYLSTAGDTITVCADTTMVASYYSQLILEEIG
jgi:hypothetical protein